VGELVDTIAHHGVEAALRDSISASEDVLSDTRGAHR
jgi:hypothetical protein